MEIYILRHGVAEDQAASGRDEDRVLTSDGKTRLLTILALAHHAKAKPGLILSSPFARALETAEIAGEVLNCECELIQTPSLQPDAEPRQVWNELRTHKDMAAILLAGHNPLVSRLVALLLNSPALNVDFRKGAMVRIDVDAFGFEPRGVLKWMITSKLSA